MDPKHVDRHPYFDGKRLPAAQDLFVTWIDAMGIQSSMKRSPPTAANFIFKLHIAALEAPRSLKMYPVMDGIYVVARTASDTQLFLGDVLARLADMFVCEATPAHRFVVRAGVARGKVVHGDAIPLGVSDTLDLNPRHRDSIILGQPVINAYVVEGSAPPFGVFVHESAGEWGQHTPADPHVWAWYDERWKPLAVELRSVLDKYYDWCTTHPGEPPYDRAAIERHRKAAHDFLPLTL